MGVPSHPGPRASIIRRMFVRLLPRGLRIRIRSRVNELRRAWKAPAMVWGFRSADGTWQAGTRMSDTVFIYHPERVRVADRVFVWHYSILDGTGGLEIGTGSQIGAWVGIFTHSSHVAVRLYGAHYGEVPEAEKVAFGIAPVSIGRYVFVAAGAKILPGVTIGDGALVAASSVVNRDVGPFEIVAGNPAKVVGTTRKLDEAWLADERIRGWYAEWQASEGSL